MYCFTIDFHGSHIPTHIELCISNYLQWEEFVQYPQYYSVILALNKKVIIVDGDILIVISGISHPEVWICLGREESNHFELIRKASCQVAMDCFRP